MVGVGKRFGRAISLLGLGFAGAVGAFAATPPPEAWTADPEEQFLLDISLRQLRLGDGVRAYSTPEGTCVLFGDFVGALDVPITIDLAARKADGWAFSEENRISIDAAAGTVRYGNRRESLSQGTVRETPEGWCVESGAVSRWFGISVKPITSAAALVIESKDKLPVELAFERRKRAELLKPAKFDLDTLPQVRLPYRMWRAPALDFVVNAGITYRADTGVKVDRRTSVYAAGEIAQLSYDAQVSTDQKGSPAALRVRAFRSDPDGGLLGPLGATHVGVGDVAALDSRLGHFGNGRGAVVTNRPLVNPTSFDRTRFEGDLPAGWEAEIYRNGELLAFARPTPDQRYVFEDVQLFYGENRISIVLYGPQGQVRTRDELVNVGEENVPPGKTWYWAGFNQPGRDLVSFDEPPEFRTHAKLQAAVAVDHGLDQRTSVGALARMMLIEDERVTFVEGSVRRSIGRALVEVGAVRDSGGGSGARAQAVAKLGSVNLSGDALVGKDLYLDGLRQEEIMDLKLSANAPIHIGRTLVPAQADVRLLKRGDGSTYLEAAGRLAASIDRFNLASEIRYRRHLSHGPAPPAELEASLIGAGRIGEVRVRGAATMSIAPQPRLRAVELSGYWSASDKVDWEGAIAYEPSFSRARARISHVRRFSGLGLALTGEAASDGSLAVGLNLNFSLDASRGLRFSRQPLAGAGAVHARVYRDLNDNGRRDSAEPLEPGALITAGTRLSDKPTDERGSVLIGGLATYVPLAVGVDLSSLPDPMLVPRKALQVVVPRPGIPAQVEIGLVGGGDIEGAIVKNGGLGFEGLDLQLLDSAGVAIATARTDYDGYFLFERVAYGNYRLRVAPEAAAAAGIGADLQVEVMVTPDESVARLGSIQVRPLPRIASRD